jgi:hypothetical protein
MINVNQEGLKLLREGEYEEALPFSTTTAPFITKDAIT